MLLHPARRSTNNVNRVDDAAADSRRRDLVAAESLPVTAAISALNSLGFGNEYCALTRKEAPRIR